MNPFQKRTVAISELYQLNIITPKDVQRMLDMERVNEMVSYQESHFDKHGFLYNIGDMVCLKSKEFGMIMYLLDGQHRFETFKRVQHLAPTTQVSLIIIDNDIYKEDIHEIFNRINTSVPVPNYLKDTISKAKFKELESLIQHYSLYFSTSSKPQRPNVNIELHINEDLAMSDAGKELKTAQELLEFLEFSNNVFERSLSKMISTSEFNRLKKPKAGRHLYLGFHRDLRLSEPTLFEAYKMNDSEFVLGTKPKSKRDKIPKEVKRLIWERDYGNVFKGKCPFCPKETDASGFEIGHKIPWSKSGNDHPDNLFLLCSECNKQMGNKSYEEFKR